MKRTKRYTAEGGYAEVSVDRAWRLASLSGLEELFTLTDEQILAIPTIGPKTLEAIRRRAQSYSLVRPKK